MKHTSDISRGPWWADMERGYGPKGNHGILIYAKPLQKNDTISPIAEVTGAFNARLISAAPELLAVAQRAYMLRHVQDETPKWTKAEIDRSWAAWDKWANETIRKVKGEDRIDPDKTVTSTCENCDAPAEYNSIMILCPNCSD